MSSVSPPYFILHFVYLHIEEIPLRGFRASGCSHTPKKTQKQISKMKKTLLFGLCAAACIATASGQSKITSPGRVLIERYNAALSEPSTRSTTEPATVTAVVTLTDGTDAGILEHNGCHISSRIGNMVIVSATVPVIKQIAALDEVVEIDFGSQSKPYMDKARECSNVDVVHDGSGNGLGGHAYTGKDVMVGLYDTGFDPNHAAFRDNNGKTRVDYIYVSRYNTSKSQEITNPDDIAVFTTEEPGESHGTHVLGIIAGSTDVKGEARGISNGALPYYGVAPDANLIIGCGDFETTAILNGLAKVVERGKASGRPTVVNLSLGNNSGSHDPNSTTGKIIDELGKDAIICIAAGNEGDYPMALKQRFTARNKTLNTFISPQNQPSSALSYTAEFWNDTADEFTCKLVIYDKASGTIADSYEFGNMEGRSYTWDTSKSSVMAQHYTSGSGVYLTSSVDNSTGRYNVYFQGNLAPKSNNPTVAFGVNITGKSGNTVFGYVNTLNNSPDMAVFKSENVTGYANGQTDGTINGFGCAHNMISVGAYVSRVSAPYINEGNYSGSGTQGDIAAFSSYGELADGRRLPHVCAPGAQIVSSVSTYWIKNLPGFNKAKTNAFSDSFSRESYYYPMQGTSMATPFVAGTVALWLEAWPEMTTAQCLEIIEETAIKDNYVNKAENAKRWGAGKIDALAGLKLAIQRSASLNEVSADDAADKMIVEALGGKRYSVFVGGTDGFTANLYNMQGALTATVTTSGDTAEVDASQLSEGIYVLEVQGKNLRTSRKFMVK